MTDRIIGRNPVLESLRAGKRRARRLFALRDGKGLEAIAAAAAGIPIEWRNRAELDKLAPGAVHQGVILEAEPIPLLPVEQWLKQAHPADAYVVVLDCIEDPHNFGAIVRSAAACGAHAVIFAKDRSAPISPASIKSAAGAMEYIDLVVAVNLVRALEGLKKAGYWVAGLEADAPLNLWEGDLKGRVALVIGSEGKGIRRLVREHCDFLLRIPLTGPISSLNASVSAAVALVECMRQRASAAKRGSADT